MTEQGFAPSKPGQLAGNFVVLSVGTGEPVEVAGRVVAKGSVIYNWKTGKTLTVRAPISEIISISQRGPRRFSFFKVGTPAAPRSEVALARPMRKRFQIF
ncbi:MAG: hypothetical protein ACREA9_29010 [Pyrinomonadaceae bacterium]